MSDNQKPSRDTGEEVCLTCGEPKDSVVHLEMPSSVRAMVRLNGHPYKPAPKAPVSVTIKKCRDCGREGKPGDWSECFTVCDVCWPVEPKAPVREDREGWLTENRTRALVQTCMFALRSFKSADALPPDLIDLGKLERMALSALASPQPSTPSANGEGLRVAVEQVEAEGLYWQVWRVSKITYRAQVHAGGPSDRWQEICLGKTPEEALKAALARAREAGR